MSRPIVIVEPTSAGIELAPTFKARGVPAIAVSLGYQEWREFGSKARAADFLEVIPNQPGIEELIRKFDPIGVIPGTEEAIPLADRLTASLTPQFANDPGKALHRSHKSLMQQALRAAGVPALKTLHTASEQEAELWLSESGLEGCPLVIKPPSSSGSERVFHVPGNGDWKGTFNRVLTEPSALTGRQSETAVIQELAVGTEFAVGTVSAHGKHYLTHLMRYNKSSSGERKTVFDHVEFVRYDEETLGELLRYTQSALDALGVRFGASHNEIMLTKAGPRLIETSPRMIGGPVVGFAREASGSSQADRLAELYVDGDVVTREYAFRKTVVPVFLKAVSSGTISNVEALDDTSALPTLLSRHVWVKNGDRVPQTVDYLTSIGIIGLSGDRDSIFRDYEMIRSMESKLEYR